MWAEERTHRCMELTAMEHVDPHGCSCNHHRCIHHQVKVHHHLTSKLSMCYPKLSSSLEWSKSISESSGCITTLSSPTGAPTSIGYNSSVNETSSMVRGGTSFAIEEEESKVIRITEGYDGSEGSDSIKYVGVR